MIEHRISVRTCRFESPVLTRQAAAAKKAFLKQLAEKAISDLQAAGAFFEDQEGGPGPQMFSKVFFVAHV